MKVPIEKIRELIESGEPIFILRAQDKLTVHLLYIYEHLYRLAKEREVDSDWLNDLENEREEFVHWQVRNQDKIKLPD